VADSDPNLTVLEETFPSVEAFYRRGLLKA
jgi:hypothetical protein